MRNLLLFALTCVLSLTGYSQNKLIRKLNDNEFLALKKLVASYEDFQKVNLNDTVYETQRKFNMAFTPAKLHKSNIQVWNSKDSVPAFTGVFDAVKRKKDATYFNYQVRYLMNPLKKPEVYKDQLRKNYFFTVEAKKQESWKETITRPDTVITETKLPADTNNIADSLIQVKIDTVITQVTDTIVKTSSETSVFYIRTGFENNQFTGFKIYSVTIPGKKPELEEPVEEMKWWVGLPVEWKNFFKDQYKFSDYPEYHEIRKCQALRELDLTNRNISDISFIANFTYLEKLNLSKNPIKDLSAIKNLKKLKELDITGTKVDTLLYLEKLTGLEILTISGLPITSLNHLAGLTNLKELTCSANKIKSLEPLKNLILLEELDISLNYDIKDVVPITGLANLEKLVMNKVEIGSLEPLTPLVNLIYLDCYNAGISDLSPIKKLPKLMHLDLSHNSISDLGPLRSLRYITFLGLGSTKVSDLGPISHFQHLEYLNVAGNPQLKDLSPVPKETLNTLLCQYTGIPTGDVQRFKKKNPKCKITYY